ncbi:S9 family peptidase [Sphingomonas nostoxanthinifaciens]|uniref:S9 family peptidase n=1 Tax=Sphingomonas nostoxanthinifaciens TaxID=2872652 RepID=UPI001CC1EBF3|nr:S9 family peptidase [Sphingomonas nostoxanthinifaciens]UAK24755.1 S9 family peptidase [Sphingomonas nostoxanthinifaciens]
MLLSLALALAASPSPQGLTHYSGVALDPAGQRIVSIDSVQARGAPSAGHAGVVVRTIAGAVVGRYDPCPTCSYGAPVWSPDGRALAFFASGGGQARLYLLRSAGDRAAPTLDVIASVSGVAATPRWSNDGRTIAFLATVGAHKETGATQPGARQVGLIGSQPDSKRIAVVPASGGAYRLVSPEGTFVYEYDWMPDGTGFVATAAEGDGDNQWWVASLRAFGLDGTMSTIAAPKTQMTFPRVAPDGRTVAYIGGLMSDFPVSGGDVYTVPIGGGTPTDVTPHASITFTSLVWRPGRLIAGVTKGGSTGTATIDPATQKVSDLVVAPETIGQTGEPALAPDAKGANAAYLVESFTAGPRIAFGPVGRARAITHDNDGLAPVVAVRDVHWRNGGFDVQGWLLAPAAPPQGDAKQPMVTIVHGGPSSATTPHFPWGNDVELLAQHGYWIFQPNPRGSYGQGEAFVRANMRDFGGGDLSDILAGIDAVEREAPIDDARLGVAGGSYGGFMTMWTVTHSNRFKAAAAGAGISDWIAYYGQNGIDQWMIPFFGASAYDDPAIYDKLSPIRAIKNAKTPTFVYVGERDVECPPAQSLEFWHGLRAMGVPSDLVIYADEGHGIRAPANIADRNARLIGWFDRWLAKRP